MRKIAFAAGEFGIGEPCHVSNGTRLRERDRAFPDRAGRLFCDDWSASLQAAIGRGCVDWKSRFYAKYTSADVPINFRFNSAADTSIFAKRFFTLWVRSKSECCDDQLISFFWIRNDLYSTNHKLIHLHVFLCKKNKSATVVHQSS